MLTDKAREELVAEALEGMDGVLDAESLEALRYMFEDLYTAHPTMVALAEERFADRKAKKNSEEVDKRTLNLDGLSEEEHRARLRAIDPALDEERERWKKAHGDR